MKKFISVLLTFILTAISLIGAFSMQTTAAGPETSVLYLYSSDGTTCLCVQIYHPSMGGSATTVIVNMGGLKKPYDWVSFETRETLPLQSFLSGGLDSLRNIGVRPGLPGFTSYTWLKIDDLDYPDEYVVHDEVNETVLLTTVEGNEFLFDIKTGELLRGELFTHYSQADLAALLAQAAAIEKGNYTDETWNSLQAAIAAAQPISTGQALRNGQYNALQAAIDGLVEKPEPPEPPSTCGCCDDHNHSNSFADRLACFFCKIIQFFRRLFSIV